MRVRSTVGAFVAYNTRSDALRIPSDDPRRGRRGQDQIMSETPRSIGTDDDTVVLQADFYRAGDGNEESFTANMIVSTQDLDGDPTGGVVQNVWVQGIGCGTALTQFS